MTPITRKQDRFIPVVNIGVQRIAKRLYALPDGSPDNPVDSIGFGTDDTSEAAADNMLGDNGETAYFKTGDTDNGGDVTYTYDASDASNPYVQIEATWSTSEANSVLYEIGISADSLTGTDPAGNDGTALVTRKRIGGAGGIGKTTDIELIGRVKLTFPQS